MPVDGIGSSITNPQVLTTDRGTFQKDTFLKVLVAQLQHPDPFAPQDMTSQMTQMVQFGMLERLFAVEQALEEMGQATRVREALDLLGKDVVLQTDSGEVAGVVEKVTFTEEGPMIVVGGEPYYLAQVTAIGAAVPPVETAPEDEAATGDSADGNATEEAVEPTPEATV